MPFAGLKIRTEEQPETQPESMPEFMAESMPDWYDPAPSEDPPTIHDPVPPPPRKGAARPSVPTVTRTMEKEVRDELEAICQMAALIWSVPDPHCGPVLSEQSKAIAATATTLLKRNPRLLSYLRSAGWFGDWVPFLMAVGPVAKAFYGHHMAPAPEQDDDDGTDPTSPFLAEYPPFLPRSGVGNPTVP